ncbi:hypothetical protein [Brevundimonas sp. TWP2-3-4b1]|uniref:hypothetical protein n=1 Tax=Brevundimonas sp. TWP2-3-4b1 TaxID=2804580 RepID=UPI003CF967CB
MFKIVCAAVVAGVVVFSGAANANAQAVRPLPPVVTTLPDDDDSNFPITGTFPLKLGAEAAYTPLTMNTNGYIFGSNDSFNAYVTDLNTRVDTGKVSYGNTPVNGRPAFILTWTSVGNCCSGLQRSTF